MNDNLPERGDQMTEERRRAIVKELCNNAGLSMGGLDEPVADTPSAALSQAPPMPPSMRPPPSPLAKSAGGPGVKSEYDNQLQSLRQRKPDQQPVRPPPPEPKHGPAGTWDALAELFDLILRGAQAVAAQGGRGNDDLRRTIREALQYSVAGVAPHLAFVEALGALVEKAEAAAGIQPAPGQ